MPPTVRSFKVTFLPYSLDRILSTIGNSFRTFSSVIFTAFITHTPFLSEYVDWACHFHTWNINLVHFWHRSLIVRNLHTKEYLVFHNKLNTPRLRITDRILYAICREFNVKSTGFVQMRVKCLFNPKLFHWMNTQKMQPHRIGDCYHEGLYGSWFRCIRNIT